MDPVPGRACGGCTVCCTELHINTPSLRKLAGVRCSNLNDDCRCAIYAARPKPCRDFECGWRMMVGLGEDWRPDRSGITLIPKTTHNPPGYRSDAGVQIMLRDRAALATPELPGLIATWVSARVPLFLTLAAPVGFVAPSAFLNDMVEAAVHRQDRTALVKAIADMADGLARRKSVTADFALMPSN